MRDRVSSASQHLEHAKLLRARNDHRHALARAAVRHARHSQRHHRRGLREGEILEIPQDEDSPLTRRQQQQRLTQPKPQHRIGFQTCAIPAVRQLRDHDFGATPLDTSDIAERMKALRKVGVPYSLTDAEYKANVAKFGETVAKQLHIPNAQQSLIEQANFGNYDGDRSGISEMDALVAYLQVLGTMVDFGKYKDDAFVNDR